MRPGALPENTSETVVCDTPARLATSTLVTLRGRDDGAPVTGRELREFAGIRRSHHATPWRAWTASCTECVLRSTVVRMTLPHLHRSSTTLARSALVALVLAGGAGT